MYRLLGGCVGGDRSDGGGELDPHGTDGDWIRLLVFGNMFGVDMQYHEWAWCAV